MTATFRVTPRRAAQLDRYRQEPPCYVRGRSRRGKPRRRLMGVWR